MLTVLGGDRASPTIGCHFVLACVVMLALSACTAREVPYEDEIASWHADKDRFMRESPDSPVLARRARDVSAASLLPDQSRVPRPGLADGRARR